MPVWLSAILCILMGYFIGCINPAYLFARIRGFDIRKTGSGNAGASNAVIVMGKTVGIISAILDIAKAVLSVRLAILLFPKLVYAGEIAGVACILGHIFPVFMGFRGGKGLAALGGVILAFDPRVFLIMLLLEILLIFITDYICFTAITASVIFPILHGFMTGQVIGALILAIAAPAILYKHMENLRRIKAGTEAHFSLLWHRDKEAQRLEANMGKQEEGSNSDSNSDSNCVAVTDSTENQQSESNHSGN
ncbi:MAG: glycerol-3-phosphate acyltransferase [Eubacteriales bacterium]